METIVPTIQETSMRENGFLVLSQTEIDADYAGDADIREFPNGATVYRDGATAIAECDAAQVNELIIWGYRCTMQPDFVPVPIHLYEVVPVQQSVIEWGPLAGVCAGIMRTLARAEYRSVPAALAFYSFILLDKSGYR